MSEAFSSCWTPVAAITLMAGFMLNGGVIFADAQTNGLQISYEGMNQYSDGFAGISDAYWHFWNLQATTDSQVDVGNWSWQLSVLGNAGLAPASSGRYALATGKPSLKISGPRYTHRFELTGTVSYDSTGLERRPLVEQWDNSHLPDSDKQRYLYGAVSSDHYVALTNRSSLIAYVIASSLDRGASIFEAYYGDADIEWEADPRLRLRLGAIGQRYSSSLIDVATAGPRATLIYQLTPDTTLETKGGVLYFDDAGGPSETGTASVAVFQYTPDWSWRLSWMRGVTRPTSSFVVTVSDVYGGKAKVNVTPSQSLQASLEHREEDWVQGFEGRSPAAASTAELKYAFEPPVGDSGAAKAKGTTLGASMSGEHIQLKNGINAQRQVLRLSVERVF